MGTDKAINDPTVECCDRDAANCDCPAPLDFKEVIQQCRTASFGLGMVHRWDTEMGYVNPCYIEHETSLRKVSAEASAFSGEAFVHFDNIALGEDSYGQADIVYRSNYRSLLRDFPGFPWVRVSYVNTNGLGCFVGDLTQDMLNVLVGLSVDYPVYDELDWSELEHDEIHASWGQFMAWEVRRELSRPAQDMWDALGESDVSDIWWACVSADVFGNYPEHSGVEVMWGDIKERAADFRPFLIAAYVTKVRQGCTLPAAYEWVPILADKGYRTGPDGLVFIGTKGN